MIRNVLPYIEKRRIERKESDVKTKWFSFVLLALFAYPVYAESDFWIDSVSLAYGHTHDDIDVGRLAVRKDSDFQWLSNPTGWFSLYYEASLNMWKKASDKVYAAAISPVLIYYFGKPDNLIRPYIEGGIGAACLSKTEIGGYRQFSTAFQFEDRVGAGLQYKNADLCFRYMHYSNASIKQPNDGIDIFMLAFDYRL